MSPDGNSVAGSYYAKSLLRLHKLCESEFKAYREGLTSLELAFASKSLRTLCENEAQAIKELGPAVAEILKHRLADLSAALSIKDLVAGRPRELDGADCQYIAVDICNGYRIVFCANHPSNPVVGSGEIDWPKVSRIKILRIESDYVE